MPHAATKWVALITVLLAVACKQGTGRIGSPLVPEGSPAGAAGEGGAGGALAPTAFGAPAPTAGDSAPVEMPPPGDLSLAPAALSQTGLFADVRTQTLASGVEPYSPAYELWSDGAAKRRWAQLPPHAAIDSADMDAWNHPVGTKLWKEFSRDGRALETRYMAKHGSRPGDWTFMAYRWNELGDEAFAVPGGVPNVAGTTHDIPSTVTCLICHGAYPAAALGFSAIQLAHAGPGVTVDALLARGQLTAAPASALHIPGDPVAQRALGYLHANCGSCHNAHTAPSFGPAAAHVVFWQSAAQLGSVEQTTTYVNMVTNTGGDLSSLIRGASRMRLRQLGQMPPIATKLVDHAGVALVDAWLQQLGAPAPLQ